MKRKRKRSRSIWPGQLPSNSIAIIEESDSELGAAMGLLRSIIDMLHNRRQRLPSYPSLPFRSLPGWLHYSANASMYRKLWKLFLLHPAEILTSIGLSIVFTGIFVAESSGNVLSANIVSDTIALVSSPRCSAIPYGSRWSRSIAYVDRCYQATLGADGCNDFYNQSISHEESSISTCPFEGNVCALGQNPAFVMDTGLVDSKVLGINAPKRHLFRRVATCAPLIHDGEHITQISAEDSGDENSLILSNRPDHLGVVFYGLRWAYYLPGEGLFKRSKRLPVCRIIAHVL